MEIDLEKKSLDNRNDINFFDTTLIVFLGKFFIDIIKEMEFVIKGYLLVSVIYLLERQHSCEKIYLWQ